LLIIKLQGNSSSSFSTMCVITTSQSTLQNCVLAERNSNKISNRWWVATSSAATPGLKYETNTIIPFSEVWKHSTNERDRTLPENTLHFQRKYPHEVRSKLLADCKGYF